jgi:hypothetical protein
MSWAGLASRRWRICRALPEESIRALRATLKGRTLVDGQDALEVVRPVPHGNVAAAHVMAARVGVEKLPGPPCRQRDIAMR